jgi:hypothetical protein
MGLWPTDGDESHAPWSLLISNRLGRDFRGSVMGSNTSLGLGALRIEPFQQKCDPDANKNERPDPTRADVDRAQAREQERDPTDQK